MISFLSPVLRCAPARRKIGAHMPYVDLREPCRSLVLWLLRSPADPIEIVPPHAAEQSARLSDHLLTTAALVCCLCPDDPQRDLLRLAALCHDLPADQRLRYLGSAAERVQPWLDLLTQQGQELDQGGVPTLPPGLDDVTQRLLLAHLAASRRVAIAQRSDFATHPLAGAGMVDLVYGGSTKVKNYVFESARLPEIRGASVLLDHLNRLDVPAFWGQTPPFNFDLLVSAPDTVPDAALARAQQHRYTEVRQWFRAQMGSEPLDAPECLLYASGGNLLALAPAGQGPILAAAIEQRYTAETLTASSVAVSLSVSLLELQYGRAPQACWQDDIDQLAATSSHAARLLRQSLGADAASLSTAFAGHKGFGELVTLLANQANLRRASDGYRTGAPRYATLVELNSFARKCTSCDERPAAEKIADERQQFFCLPCATKRWVGSWAKQSNRPDLRHNPAIPRMEWVRPWDTWLQQSAAALGQPLTIGQTTTDLQELGAAARGAATGYVGLIYADGNNVSNHIAELTTVSAYRTFAREMITANERTVARALLDILRPDRNQAWPFEIITIGGDDVLLFVPADQALPLAHQIAQGFTQEMNQRAITLSVGVLLMPDNTPVRFAVDLVEQLLKSAKRRSKEDAAAVKPPTLDFMALKEVSMVAETIKDYRKAALSRPVQTTRARSNQTESLMLTQRPYLLPELIALLDACRLLQQAHFPRSQLYQLRQIIEQGQILQSVIDYHYYVGRGQRRSSDRDAYTQFAVQFARLCGEHAWLPWRINKQDEQPHRPPSTVYDTPLLDLIELYPFVSEKTVETTSDA